MPREKSKRVKKPKSPVQGPQVSRARKKFQLGKAIHREAEDIEEQIGEETEKAYERSLWASVGITLFSIAAGMATAGMSSAIMQGLYVATAATAGGYGGKAAAEVTGSKRKKVKSDLFYEKEAKAQTLAFKDFDKELSESIWQKGAMAGALAFGVKLGGQVYEKIQLGKLTKAAEGVTTTTAGGPSIASETFTDIASKKETYTGSKETSMPKYKITETSELEDVLLAGQETFETTGTATTGVETITPMTDEGLKKAQTTLAGAFKAGLSGQDIAKTQQSILLGGGYAISAYRPELAKLRPVQFRTPRGLSYS